MSEKRTAEDAFAIAEWKFAECDNA